MKEFKKILFNAHQIQSKILELGQQITQDYQGKNLTVIGVLKGAFVFMADLVLAISLPLRCDFLRISSYDSKGKRGNLRLDFDLTQSVEDQHVLLIEDILDSGKTLQFLREHLKSKNPQSLEICCLLDKQLNSDLSKQVKYKAFECPQEYIVGYGMDLDGLYRNLPEIMSVNQL